MSIKMFVEKSIKMLVEKSMKMFIDKRYNKYWKSQERKDEKTSDPPAAHIPDFNIH